MQFDDLPIQRRSTQGAPIDDRGGGARLVALMVAITLVFTGLGGRLFYLQTTRRNEFQREAQIRSNITRYTPATRGLIYDRSGVPLVRNTPSYQVAIVPIKQITYNNDGAVIDASSNTPLIDPETGAVIVSKAKIKQRIDRIAVYNRLATLMARPDITAGEIFTKVVQATNAGRTYEPVVVAENIPRETALVIQEQSLLLPGIEVQTVGARVYPFGDLFGNILGYTGKILDTTATQFDLARDGADLVDKDGYRYNIDNDRAGREGIEAFAERELRGHKGVRDSVVDVSLNEISAGPEVSATNGNNVRLTIDLKLQTIVSESLQYGMGVQGSPRGAVVAMNPSTGEILAMVGFPTYDNNIFARGNLTQAELDPLLNDPQKPLLNHATQEAVQPGSTFKLVSAAAILQETNDNVDANTLIDDPGVFELQNEFAPDAPGIPFYCWIGLRGGRHGAMNTELAIKNSCNTYFRKAIGGFEPEGIIGVGSDGLSKWAEAFGIGESGYELGIPYVPGYPASQEKT